MLQNIYLLLTLCFLSGNWQTYNDTSHRYTIKYPGQWTTHYVGNAVGFLSPPDNDSDIYRENVNVILQDLSKQPVTLKQYTTISKNEYIKSYGASSIVSLKDTVMEGIPAEVGVFAMQMHGNYFKLKQCWFIKNKTAYLLTYTAILNQYERFLPTAMKIFSSFKVLK